MLALVAGPTAEGVTPVPAWAVSDGQGGLAEGYPPIPLNASQAAAIPDQQYRSLRPSSNSP